MEKIQTIVFVGLIGIFVIGFVKKYAKEYAVVISILIGIIISVYLLTDISSILDQIKSIAEKTSIDSSVLKSLLKICLISVFGQFGQQVCRDAGENAVADRIETAVGVFSVLICMPYFIEIINCAMELQ